MHALLFRKVRGPGYLGFYKGEKSMETKNEELAKKLIEKFGNIYEALESKRTLTKEEARLLEELDETVKILVRN
ncbi:hypothetical protein UFOVP591_37 [uncultured Caudovirales phage]|uniref:Uncharacterized protein n=1 Tax=uncultured Caudovirales phage TaxID=2100421 RepID=A0A6J5N3C1_9CAUD|nr:hypothetical protein UFOVP591_37 [uncultured Caudovirales phage]